MKSYLALTKQSFSADEYQIVPIRYEDRMDILRWRNEQVYHLRQAKPLTEEDQENYFKNVVSKLFDQEQPNQILFSYLKNGECIGYGGLVHINWIDKHAEISFVLNTTLEANEFHLHWGIYLGLIEKIAFQELKFHKIFTYAFDLRPHLYEVLEQEGYYKEATLKEHCFFNETFIDVILHAKINPFLEIVEADINHAQLLFEWANEPSVRANSLNSEPIVWENHLAWFTSKLSDTNTRIFVFYANKQAVGQVRIDFIDEAWLIDFSVDQKFRGKGMGTKMLQSVLDLNSFDRFKAEVKSSNTPSLSVFQKLGFIEKDNGTNELVEFYYQK